ncbi:MAG: hypothetical protein JW738_10040, partial [Actinobacteria bacterium]|nr:hypothetical protein [Actinomycetota bacterium]
YGNILNRKTFTVDQLKSIKSFTSTYHWKNKADVEGDTTFTGIPADFLIDNITGLLDSATSVMNYASDGWGFKDEWTLDEIRDTYANGNKFLYAWNADGTDLEPDPGGDGPIEMIKPQFDPDDTNTSKWLKWTRNISVMPDDDNPRLDDAALAAMPTDRVIATGSIDANNVPNYWYFAEGYTGGGFEEWLCIENINSWETKVIIEYQIEGEGTQQQELQVAPRSRTTIKVNDVIGDGKNVSATVEGYHGDSIVAERAMYWNGQNGGHCAAGVTEPATDWYLAEGSTGLGFETWILVQNPGDEKATVGFTYMTAAGEKIGPAFELDGHMRKTICVADVLNNEVQVSTRVHSDQPVIAERAMYWNNRAGGHCATGTPTPGTEWYLAEGSTSGFETWVLIQNPNAEAAQVQVTYMNEAGEQAGPVVDLPANSRASVDVGVTVPNDFSVSTKLTSDKPVVAERAMYWNNRKGGHCEHAVDYPKFRSFLAEGATAGGFETWVLVQNPGTMDATVNITYLTGEGAVMRDPVVVPAGTRMSINAADTVPDNYNVSTQIYSSAPVAVERAVYWNNRVEGSCANGYLTW